MLTQQFETKYLLKLIIFNLSKLIDVVMALMRAFFKHNGLQAKCVPSAFWACCISVALCVIYMADRHTVLWHNTVYAVPLPFDAHFLPAQLYQSMFERTSAPHSHCWFGCGLVHGATCFVQGVAGTST